MSRANSCRNNCSCYLRNSSPSPSCPILLAPNPAPAPQAQPQPPPPPPPPPPLSQSSQVPHQPARYTAYSYPSVQSGLPLIRYRSLISSSVPPASAAVVSQAPQQFGQPLAVPSWNLQQQRQSVVGTPSNGLRYEEVEAIDLSSHIQNKIVTISSSNTEDDFEMVSMFNCQLGRLRLTLKCPPDVGYRFL
ncbi:hypothetical protein RUM44_001508 [Polyplax serrata]|uniref:Uncharacterized protein n=1 Tax=Polyplax serrata TaxID=468196 RepID=A0ABR1AK75_POLSC